MATSELLWLRKKVFGKMIEKYLPIDPRQLTLFTEEEMGGASVDNSEAVNDAAEEEKLRKHWARLLKIRCMVY